MYYRDHGPAHFRAIYGDFEITIESESGRVNGEFPNFVSSRSIRNCAPLSGQTVLTLPLSSCARLCELPPDLHFGQTTSRRYSQYLGGTRAQGTLDPDELFELNALTQAKY